MKKRRIRRPFSVLLALVVIVGTFNLPMNVKEARADGPGQQQIGASSAYWEVIDGVLYITGSGNLPDYSAISYQPWYSVRDSITSISIDPGITGLGKNNFDGLRNVTSISVPDSVTSIGQYCFQNSGIESVVINGSNITINGYAFANCKNLKNVSFSGEVHYDHDGAFYGCENLEAVTFGSINRLGQLDFYKCPKLEKIVINNIPDGFTISKRVFGDSVAGIPVNLYIVIPDGKSIADLGIGDATFMSALSKKVVTQSQYDAIMNPSNGGGNGNNNGNNSSSNSASETPVHQHNYEWVVTQEPTFTNRGINSLACTSCGHVAETVYIGNDAVVYNTFANELETQINSATVGTVVKINLGDWHSLPQYLMERIVTCGRDVELTYRYKGIDYDIIIPAGRGILLDIPWYGPLLMYSIYGNI